MVLLPVSNECCDQALQTGSFPSTAPQHAPTRKLPPLAAPVGRPVSHPDSQIAAIAHSRGMAVATRNIRDFEDMGIALINPWTSA